MAKAKKPAASDSGQNAAPATTSGRQRNALLKHQETVGGAAEALKVKEKKKKTAAARKVARETGMLGLDWVTVEEAKEAQKQAETAEASLAIKDKENRELCRKVKELRHTKISAAEKPQFPRPRTNPHLHLQSNMGLGEDKRHYSNIREILRAACVTSNVLFTIPFSKQDPTNLADVYRAADEVEPYLKQFPAHWASAAIVQTFMSNKRQHARDMTTPGSGGYNRRVRNTAVGRCEADALVAAADEELEYHPSLESLANSPPPPRHSHKSRRIIHSPAANSSSASSPGLSSGSSSEPPEREASGEWDDDDPLDPNELVVSGAGEGEQGADVGSDAGSDFDAPSGG